MSRVQKRVFESWSSFSFEMLGVGLLIGSVVGFSLLAFGRPLLFDASWVRIAAVASWPCLGLVLVFFRRITRIGTGLVSVDLAPHDAEGMR